MNIFCNLILSNRYVKGDRKFGFRRRTLICRVSEMSIIIQCCYYCQKESHYGLDGAMDWEVGGC